MDGCTLDLSLRHALTPGLTREGPQPWTCGEARKFALQGCVSLWKGLGKGFGLSLCWNSTAGPWTLTWVLKPNRPSCCLAVSSFSPLLCLQSAVPWPRFVFPSPATCWVSSFFSPVLLHSISSHTAQASSSGHTSPDLHHPWVEMKLNTILPYGSFADCLGQAS